MGTGHSWEQFSSLSNSQLTKTFGHCSTKTMHQLGSHPGSGEQLGTHGNTQQGSPSPPKLNNFAFKPRLCFGWAPKAHVCTSRAIWRCPRCPRFPV